MLWLKSCPRCKGDLFETGDQFGAYLKCVQCGCHLSDAETALLLHPVPHQESGGDAVRPAAAGPLARS